VSHEAAALAITGAILVGTVAFALYSVRRIKMDPTQYIVGGRSFGALFLWILLAGEVYTSFTFLGAAGWAYGKGAPAFYILAYGTIGYIIGYFYLPEVWRIGKAKGLLTSPDFFQARYGSKVLTTSVAVLQFFLIIRRLRPLQCDRCSCGGVRAHRDLHVHGRAARRGLGKHCEGHAGAGCGHLRGRGAAAALLRLVRHNVRSRARRITTLAHAERRQNADGHELVYLHGAAHQRRLLHGTALNCRRVLGAQR
jgi:hypothetical protein